MGEGVPGIMTFDGFAPSGFVVSADKRHCAEKQSDPNDNERQHPFRIVADKQCRQHHQGRYSVKEAERQQQTAVDGVHLRLLHLIESLT